MFIHWGFYAVPAGFYQYKPVSHIGDVDHEQGQNSDLQ
ncbi:MAG: hypothetical protein WCK57_08910 [Verrucomicrobiae bacterium]